MGRTITAEKGSKEVEIFDDRYADEDDYLEEWDGTDDDGDYIEQGRWAIIIEADDETAIRWIDVEYETPEIVLHMIDAKNIERMLNFTIQLIEANLPVILVLNMMDEAEKSGKQIDVKKLSEQLQIPVVPTVCTSGKGVDILKGVMEDYVAKAKKEN